MKTQLTKLCTKSFLYPLKINHPLSSKVNVHELPVVPFCRKCSPSHLHASLYCQGHLSTRVQNAIEYSSCGLPRTKCRETMVLKALDILPLFKCSLGLHWLCSQTRHTTSSPRAWGQQKPPCLFTGTGAKPGLPRPHYVLGVYFNQNS